MAGLAAALPARFEGDKVLLDGRDVSDAIRSETCSRSPNRARSKRRYESIERSSSATVVKSPCRRNE